MIYKSTFLKPASSCTVVYSQNAKKDIAILYTKDCIIPKTAEPGKLCTFFEKLLTVYWERS